MATKPVLVLVPGLGADAGDWPRLRALVNDPDSRALLSLIGCPTLVLAARQDAYFSVEQHEFLATAVAGARLAVVEESGHSSALERPRAVTALIRTWLTNP